MSANTLILAMPNVGRPGPPRERGGGTRDANSMRMRMDLETRITRWAERLTLFRAIRTIVGIAVVLVLIAGLLERLVDSSTFTSIWLAYWWAVTTVTTVGYGDVVPESAAGRVVAVCLMLVGLSLIPTLTSMVVSVLISKRSRADRLAAEEERRENAAALSRIEERLDRLDRASGRP
jgi:voltage-gated potassium channel